MHMMFRMSLAITSLFMLFLVGFMAIGWLLGVDFYFIVILSLGFIFLQWLIGPRIIKWIYKIEWVEMDYFDGDTQQYIRDIVKDNRIKMPRFGIINEDNPNAFCFGRTRNDAYLVVTKGIFKYCDPDEARAVIGHELGHIVHNDFIVMTLVACVPLIFYILARGCFEACKRPSSGRNDGKTYIAIIGAISYVIYFISNLIVMLISRYREYWADEFAARTTGNPQYLTTALIKIAYGLATESKSSQENKKKDKHYENALMIFDSTVARNLAFNASSVRDRQGEVEVQDMKEAMAWDMWNPWAKYLEIFMTHPLPAKRITRLDKVGESMGLEKFLDFDLVQPESYWDEFFEDIFAKYSFLIPLVVGVILIPNSLMGGLGLICSGVGLCWFFYLVYYRYPKPFRVTNIETLIDDPKASPIRGMPVRIRGKIIGRGTPGLIFNEDLKLDDGRGIILLDYHQVSKIIDVFVGLFGTEKYLDEKDVEIIGWYRRIVTPYVEIYKMHVHGKTRDLYTRSVYAFLCLFLLVFGGWMMMFSSIVVFSFLSLGILFCVMYLYYMFIQAKYRREYPIDKPSG